MFFCSQLHISRYVHPSLHVSPLFFPATSQAARGKGECVWVRGKKKGPVQRTMGIPGHRSANARHEALVVVLFVSSKSLLVVIYARGGGEGEGKETT